MPSCLKTAKQEKISAFQTQHFTLWLWIPFFPLLLKKTFYFEIILNREVVSPPIYPLL